MQHTTRETQLFSFSDFIELLLDVKQFGAETHHWCPIQTEHSDLYRTKTNNTGDTTTHDGYSVGHN